MCVDIFLLIKCRACEAQKSNNNKLKNFSSIRMCTRRHPNKPFIMWLCIQQQIQPAKQTNMRRHTHTHVELNTKNNLSLWWSGSGGSSSDDGGDGGVYGKQAQQPDKINVAESSFVCCYCFYWSSVLTRTNCQCDKSKAHSWKRVSRDMHKKKKSNNK